MFVNGQKWIDLCFSNKVRGVLYCRKPKLKLNGWFSGIAAESAVSDNILNQNFSLISHFEQTAEEEFPVLVKTTAEYWSLSSPLSLATFIMKVNVQTLKAFCPMEEAGWVLTVSLSLGAVNNRKNSTPSIF